LENNREFLIKVARRNLGRRPRRTVLLILGIALANALTIWILTFRESSYHTMMENILGMKYGQEQITKRGYYDFDKGSINPYAHFSKEEVKHLPKTFTLRTQGTVLMASDANAIPVLLNGYDLQHELELSKLSTILPKSYRLKEKFGLVLGKRLADALSVTVGSQIAMIGQAVDGSVANEMFHVEKILDLGGGEFEKNFAVTEMNSMQDFLSMPPDDVHLLVNFGPLMDKKLLASDLKKVKWQNLLPEIASSSGFMERFTRFYAIFFALVAALAMANTLSLSFLERVKEYRMSTIIGAPVEWLRKSMGLEIFFISLTSMVLGNILILLAILFFYFFPLNLSLLTGGAPLQMGGIILTQDVKIRPELWVFLSCNIFFVIILTLAALYPMRVVMKRSQKV
jgi:ABC-type lipoprotein release transport system permease subunit